MGDYTGNWAFEDSISPSLGMDATTLYHGAKQSSLLKSLSLQTMEPECSYYSSCHTCLKGCGEASAFCVPGLAQECLTDRDTLPCLCLRCRGVGTPHKDPVFIPLKDDKCPKNKNRVTELHSQKY